MLADSSGHYAQIESDLHLETHDSINFQKFLPRKGKARYLFLAGDICPIVTHTELYRQCMSYCSSVWSQVYVVTGNHEYYGNGVVSVDECDSIARQICQSYSNVHFMQRDSAYIADIDLTILGATLWSDTTRPILLQDYNMIMDAGRPITHYTTQRWHNQDVTWLEAQIDSHTRSGSRILVLTHHLPTPSLIPARYVGTDTDIGFASNLEYLLVMTQYWICGHSHVPMSRTVGDCQVILNPRGYKGETIYHPRVVCLNG